MEEPSMSGTIWKGWSSCPSGLHSVAVLSVGTNDLVKHTHSLALHGLNWHHGELRSLASDSIFYKNVVWNLGLFTSNNPSWLNIQEFIFLVLIQWMELWYCASVRLLLFSSLPFCYWSQRGLVRGFSFRLLNAINMQPAVTSFGGAGGAPQDPNDKYINFEPP